MSDREIARVGRVLAAELDRFAHDRDPQQRKAIAVLQTELCALVRMERAEAAAAKQLEQLEPPHDQPEPSQ
jgi:hypothetical protein